MTESWQHPRKVKVTVIDDEKLPTTVDLREEIRHGIGEATKRASVSIEPDWREKYLRLAAELDNTKKRSAQAYKRQAEQEKERLLSDFLEVADSLEKAVAHADVADPEALVQGMKAIQRQFRQILLKHDVQPYEAKEQPFDPERHEAVGMHHQPGVPPNTVIHVTQTGYTIGDSVLRPARVIVSNN